MPGGKAISPEEANLSIDFIVGFTIFMIAFIFVATMMSGLLINLQSRTIDYDAVAYRTSVVLVEDPGQPYDWNLLNLIDDRNQLERLGLSIARNNPDIVQESKIQKFFEGTSGCSGQDRLCYPSDYSQNLIFGDYPYQFNISFKNLDDSSHFYLGEIPPGTFDSSPGNYGYIRRVVGVKKPGYAIINTTNSSSNELWIRMIFQDLNAPRIATMYSVNPVLENVTIHLQNFTIPDTRITGYSFWRYSGPSASEITFDTDSPTIRAYIDGSEIIQPYSSIEVTNDTKFVIEDGFFKEKGLNEFSEVELRIDFTKTVSDGYVVDFEQYVQVPPISPGVLEVSIW